MISVCMATYNGEKYIKEQIQSILGQLTSEDELIISDDGSKDKTLEIVKSFQDSRIKILYNNQHNYTKNFQNAIQHAKGEYLFLCDQDDVWVENKVAEFMKCFKETGCDFIVSDGMVVDQDKKVMDKSYFAKGKVKKGFLANWLKTSYVGACMAFRSTMLKRVLPIPGNTKYIAHDYWIACIAEAYYKVQLIKKPLILYRRHSENVSSTFKKSSLSVLQRIYKRLYTLYFLIGRRR